MKQRTFYLDFLRSLAMLLVVLLHSITPYLTTSHFGSNSWYIHLVLNAFCRTAVPLFFMISGSLMLSADSSRNFKQFYKKRIPRILIPLVFWNFAYFVYRWYMGYTAFDLRLLLNASIEQGTEYHLWYLYTLLSLYLVTPFFKILADRLNAKQQLYLLLLMLTGSVLPFINTVTGLYFYFTMPVFNSYISLYFMGYFLSRIQPTRKTVICFSVIGLLCLFLSVSFNHTYSSATEINLIFNYGNSFCHYLLAASVFILSKAVFGKTAVLPKTVAALSKYSFGVYLLHVMVMDFVSARFMIDAAPTVSALYLFFVSFSVSLLLSFLLGKIKYIRKLILYAYTLKI